MDRRHELNQLPEPKPQLRLVASTAESKLPETSSKIIRFPLAELHPQPISADPSNLDEYMTDICRQSGSRFMGPTSFRPKSQTAIQKILQPRARRI